MPGIRTGGGTAFAGDAIVLASDQLEMTNPRRPRFVYVLSDGGWYDTPRRRRSGSAGSPSTASRPSTSSIGVAPLSVEADRIVVITDPADALDQIAADTVAALRAAARAPPRHHHLNGPRMPNPQPRPPPTTTPCCARPGALRRHRRHATGLDGTLERVALEHLELAPNARRDISPRRIERARRRC